MKMWLFIALLMSAIGGAAYFVYQDTQTTIKGLNTTIVQLRVNNETLENNILTLKGAIAQSDETIAFLENSYDNIVAEYEAANAEFQVIRSTNSELRERLGRHEIDALAFAKPELVERAINNASSNAARCLELLSGASLTEGERNAKNEREFNSECPWLFGSDTISR